MKQISINYDIKNGVCEFKNNRFSDVTLMRGDQIVITHTLEFDGKNLSDITSKPKKVGLSYA